LIQMKRYLIIQTAFLGDVVLATSMIESIHATAPDIKISMLVRDGNQHLLKDHPYLEHVIVWKKNSGKIKSLLHVINEIRKIRFDAVINLQRFFSSGLITAVSGSPVRSGFSKNPLSFLFSHKTVHVIGDGRHETERNISLLKGIIDVSCLKPKLYPSEKDKTKTSAFKDQPYVTMAPASVWFTKQLPVQKWIELCGRVPDHIKVYLIGAPSDKQLCDKILSGSGRNNILNLAGEFSILQTASLMENAQMNFVNDSGPLHLASAMNAPVTAFFCSTVPAFGFGPLSEQSSIIETKQPLTCRPCGLHGKKECPEKHFRCGTEIDLTDIRFN
jgi:ADP-heptose:LPS heptosyltransferase